MIRILDKGFDEDLGMEVVLQKVISPKGKVLRYQTVPVKREPHDNHRIKYHVTLADARAAIGKGELSGAVKKTRSASMEEYRDYLNGR